MPEFRRRLTLEALIEAPAEQNADAILAAMTMALEAKFAACAIEDTHEIYGRSSGRFSLSEAKPVSVRGPRAKKEA